MKKKLCCIVVSVLNSLLLLGQSVGINNTTPHASAILDVKSNTKGMLIPRTSSASRMAIANPAKGLMIYDTTTSSFWFYNGSAWRFIADGNNTWNLSGNTAINPANNFIGTTDAQSLRFRVNNTWAGEIHPTSWNVFLGLGAGQSNTVGQGSTAIGEHTLYSNTTGTSNTATGSYALNSNTTGNENVAQGSLALFYNTVGNQNTAEGGRALYNNTTGNNNTATGFQALALNSAGNENTASGFQALYSNTSSYNTAIGSQALYSNTIGYDNTAIGSGALYYNSTGASNTASGSGALHSNTIGNNNTAYGDYSLFSNSTGSNNTATGYETLLNNTTGNNNTANGMLALSYNTSGSENTAIGVSALSSNSTGSENTASGNGALAINTTGSNNVANGYQALYYNTSGYFNTATGYQALYSNSTGWYNVAIGSGALSGNTNGIKNIAIGTLALGYNISGIGNIAIGFGSGTHPNYPNIYNTISIGNDDLLNAYQNQVFIGNTSIGWIGGKVTWSTYSDARIKNTIMEDVKGLEFILRLRPVTYHISNKAMITLTGNKETPDFPGKNDNEKVKYTGFIAQEVEQAAKAAGYDFSGYAAPKNQWGLYSISYEQFVVPLVKAVQEQQLIIQSLATQVEAAKAEIPMQIGKQQVIIDEQNKKIEMLVKELQQIKDKLK